MVHRVCWSAWLVGTGLIILSWVDFVSPTVGWAGFGIALGATLLSYIPQRYAPRRAEDWACLTKAMIESKDSGYETAMGQLRRGGAVFYDGITIAVRPGNEFALGAVTSLPVAELDDVRVHQEVDRAKAAFETLARISPEVAGFADNHQLRITLFSKYGTKGFEICRVVDGKIEWKTKGKGTDYCG